MSDPNSPDQQPLPQLPRRAADSHKGNFGLALIVGGSRGMAGAVALAGMAALRGGAGLVRLAVPDDCFDTVAGFEPSYMTVALPSDPAGRISLAAREKIVQLEAAATVLALGPGMGRSPELDTLVGWLYTNVSGPMVVDADGLNALAAQPDLLDRPGGPRILTPHLGEFARLLGKKETDPICVKHPSGHSGKLDPPTSSPEREQAAVDLAGRCKVVLVLKGSGTLITDGEYRAINTTGNPGMATGGTGDVLTGLIAALACQNLSPLDAARLGVYLHGLAGDLAAEQAGQESLIASDLIRFLPGAFDKYRKQQVGQGSP